MDRPERPDNPNSESIFSKPDPTDDPTTPPPEPDQPQNTLDPLDVSTWGPPAPGKAAPPLPGKPRVQAADGGGLSPRMLVGLGSAGAIALVLIGFIAFSVIGDEDEPLVVGGDVSPTPTASPSAEPTTAATPEPTASPEPTPKPTPGRPAGRARDGRLGDGDRG